MVSSRANCTPRHSGYTYVSTAGGHRESYNETFSRITGLENLIQRKSLSTTLKLLRAERLLFSTMENDPLYFFFVAICRALCGRDTVAIAMNVDVCFRGTASRRLLKQLFYRTLTIVERVRLISILPFDLDSRYRKLSNHWIYDPQFWDLADRVQANALPNSALADYTLRKSEGRPILLFLGGVSASKGIEYLYDGFCLHSEWAGLVQLVIAGRVPDEHKSKLAVFEQRGGIVIDRHLTDEEFISLANMATSLWACYQPTYNSSSGIFGRALQLGKSVIVRRGAIIAGIASQLGYPVYQCSFGDIGELASVLQLISREGREDSPPRPRDIAQRCREVSVERALAALNIPQSESNASCLY